MAKIGQATQQAILSKIAEALSVEYDVLRIGSNAFGIPAVEGEEETAVKIVVSIPTGSRETKEAWDVYEAEAEYRHKLEQDAIKAAKREEAKQKKIKKDKKARAEKNGE